MQGMEFGEPENASKRPLAEGTEQMLADPMEVAEAQRPTKKRASNPTAANQKHIKTEQARRDKISAGFNALQELMPSRERVEKAALLTQAAGYITQLQAVLSAVLTNGAVNKLPDELQWQIRSLLPRKDAAAPRQPSPQQGAAPGLAPGSEGQIGDPTQAGPPPGALNLSFLPLMTQGTGQTASPSTATTKEMSKDEGVLMAQVQAQLAQMQQQAAAAQHIQTWQQALQALQLQSAFTAQQTGQVPELQQHAFPWNTAAGPPMFKQPSREPSPVPASANVPAAVTSAQQAEEQPNPETFTELLSPTKAEPGAQATTETGNGLQQLADVATNDSSPKTAPPTQGKTRKTAAKGKKPATPKPN